MYWTVKHKIIEDKTAKHLMCHFMRSNNLRGLVCDGRRKAIVGEFQKKNQNF